MKTNYPTAPVRPQYRPGLQKALSRVPMQGVAPTSSNSLRIPSALVTERPRLVGSPQLLRRLRAAEMAAWEATRPSTKLDGRPLRQRQPQSLWRLATSPSLKNEAWLIFVLAICAAAAVGLGLSDISGLVEGWSRFVEGIRTFLMA